MWQILTQNVPRCRTARLPISLQSMYYNAIQGAGLKRKYDTDPDLALKLHNLAALAFVPKDDEGGRYH